MIVTDGTAPGHPHPNLHHGIRSITVIKDQILFGDRSPFTGRDITSIESRCDLLVE